MRYFVTDIDNSHPVMVDTDRAYKVDHLAMELVGERHGKRDLVNLVRWLIMDRANIANEYLEEE